MEVAHTPTEGGYIKVEVCNTANTLGDDSFLHFGLLWYQLEMSLFSSTVHNSQVRRHQSKVRGEKKKKQSP